MNLFAVQKSAEDTRFLKENGELVFEAATEIIGNACDLPCLGSFFKIGKIYLNFVEWGFIRKLNLFLKESENLEENEINQFLSSLTDVDNQRISDYLLRYLHNAEEEGKAILMGKIYKARIKNEIDNDIMLRLCSVVNRVYYPDLFKLCFYDEENTNDFIAEELGNVGLVSITNGTKYKEGILTLVKTNAKLTNLVRFS